MEVYSCAGAKTNPLRKSILNLLSSCVSTRPEFPYNGENNGSSSKGVHRLQHEVLASGAPTSLSVPSAWDSQFAAGSEKLRTVIGLL